LLYADYKDDIGYSKLVTELGAHLPDGISVLATQVEAATSFVDHDNNPLTPDWPVYLPDRDNVAFSGKSITDLSGYDFGTYSGHATGVGSRFYGSNSMAPAINTIHAHWVDFWLEPGFLKYGAGKPLSSSSRIGNHSWVGNVTDLAIASDLLRRIDWVIETDEFLQIVGTRNNIGTNPNLLSAAYNVLAVGKTDGNHSTGSPTVDSTYISGRTRTEIVAPLTVTSLSTPAVAAAAALLVDHGHSNTGLSTDPVEVSTTNREGDIIYNAERSEVIKAALLAGADRFTQNTSTTANISDYRVDIMNQTNNGLDARFGAGQVNVYNSYHIIAAGEHNSSEDGGVGSAAIDTHGFDYDPSFGGSNSSNNIASYYFSTDTTSILLTASLFWNIDIDGGNRPNSFSGSAVFYDLDLILYDVTGGQALLVGSTSQIDNSENIRTSLNANRDYVLQVIPKPGQSDFDWDYALAWQMESDQDVDGIADIQDNCTLKPNANQRDTDGDGYGNACDTDINQPNDGVTNSLDVGVLRQQFLTAGPDADFNGDGVVNSLDVGTLKQFFLQPPGPSCCGTPLP